MRSHRAVGSVDLGIVERRLVDAALQIVGNQQLRHTTEEAEHAHMSAGPVRQLLRPRRLGTGEVRGAEYADEYLSLVDFTRRLITNRDPLARVVHERLFAGDVVLAHHRTQPSLKTAKQIAEPAIAVALLIDLPIFLPQNHHRHAGPLQLARQGPQSGSVRRRWPVSFPARPNSRSSRASSVISSPCGHASPAAAARFRLSWIVERATPRRRPISRALTPSWRSRNRCRNCRMLSSRFAGIPISSSTIDGPRSAAVAEPRGANDQSRDRLRWPASFRNGGRHQIGTAADIKSESLAGLNRNSQSRGCTDSKRRGRCCLWQS